MRNFSKQSGVTLLLSVLILASLTLITSAMGALAIQESRSSRAIAITDPALAAAETAAERGVWTIKRGGAISTDCTNPSVIPSQPNVYITTCKSSAGTVTFNIPMGGAGFAFFLYDPNDINGDIDLQGCATCNPPSSNPAGFPFDSITFQQKSGSFASNATVTRISDGSVVGSTAIQPDGTPVTINNLAGPAGADNRMKVVITNANQDATVEVTTAPSGLPNYPTINSTACSSKTAIASCNPNNQELYTRKVQITVPQ
jgi:hypothetical protein